MRVDDVERGLELQEAEKLPSALFPAEEREHLRVVDHEEGARVGERGVEGHLGKPPGGRLRAAVREPQGLTAVKDHQRGAGDRAEGLDPSLRKDGMTG